MISLSAFLIFFNSFFFKDGEFCAIVSLLILLASCQVIMILSNNSISYVLFIGMVLLSYISVQITKLYSFLKK